MFKEIISMMLAAVLTLPCALTSADPGTESMVFAGAKAVAVLEGSCLQTAVGYEADTVLNVAGLSRLPALMYVCEAFDKGLVSEDASIVVGDVAAGVGGPTAFVAAGEKIPASALIKAAVMITAGDATYALAETAAGSATLAEKAIANLLTELNIGSGDFTLAGGKPSMTAKEVCALMAQLSKSPTYCKYSKLTLDEIAHENGSRTELANPNKLLKSLEGCYAGSTGSSNEAGYCGAFAVTRGETSYVVAVLGAKNSNERFETARDAANTAFGAYETVAAAKQGDVIASGIPVIGGLKRTVDAVSTRAVVLLVKKGDAWGVTTELPESIPAPVRKGDLLGYAVYSSTQGAEPVRVALAAAQDIGEANWGQLIAIIMRMWVHG